ncbi:hypothetical protein NPIL_261301, partial [Nephila pilipes]
TERSASTKRDLPVPKRDLPVPKRDLPVHRRGICAPAVPEGASRRGICQYEEGFASTEKKVASTEERLPLKKIYCAEEDLPVPKGFARSTEEVGKMTKWLDNKDNNKSSPSNSLG